MSRPAFMHAVRLQRSPTIGMSWLTTRNAWPWALRRPDEGGHGLAHHRVHRGEGLVEEGHARRLDEAHAELEELPLPAGKLARVEILHRRRA
jgi:hypothetical protein